MGRTPSPRFTTIVWAVLLLCPYYDSTHLAICMDHHSLCWLPSMANATIKLAQWRLHLFELDFDVVHRAGIKHQAADTLPLPLTNKIDQSLLRDKLPVLLMERNNLVTDSSSTVFLFEVNSSVPVHIADAVDNTKVLVPTLAHFRAA